MGDVLPTSIRYVKNGRGGRWWRLARSNGEVHGGWKYVPGDALQSRDYEKIQRAIKEWCSVGGRRSDYGALHDLLDSPSRHIWVTIEEDFMWWCTVKDGVTVNPLGETAEAGYFWLECDRPWSNKSLKGRSLALSLLPGTVSATRGFRATVCTPRYADSMLRLVKDEVPEDVTNAASARRHYEVALNSIIKLLQEKDFELLVELILARTGWERVAKVGGAREGVDIEAENPATGETAFVQVKSKASQSDLNKYVQEFARRRERYDRMIFAVHSPVSDLSQPKDTAVQIWTVETISELVVRVGLGKWIESRRA